MELKPGYKQTEVGVIPEDWTVTTLGAVYSFTNGFNSDKSAYGSGTKFINVLEPINLSHITAEKIPGRVRVAESQASAYAVRAGDIVLNRTSETDEDLGKIAVYTGIEQVVFGGFVIRGRQKTDTFDPGYSGYALRSEMVRHQIVSLGQGAVRANISQQSLQRVFVVVPPRPEQLAIARALLEIDQYLSTLDQLIAKKCDIRQGAMQELLTGKRRLPGFEGEWEVKRLKQVAEISTGINKPLSEMGTGSLYVTVQDLYDKTSIRTGRLSRIKVSAGEIETRSLAVGDIVFGKSSVKREGIGYPSQFLGCDEPVVFSGFTYRARARRGMVDPGFLFYALRAEKTRRWLIDNSQASALTNINQTIADSIPVSVSPDILEQSSIATIVSNMDTELSLLDDRRNKVHELKEGMMQQLLTGKIRLT